MWSTRPFVDLVEVHDPVGTTKSPQGIIPIPVLRNLWIPFDKLVDIFRDSVFHGINNDVSD